MEEPLKMLPISAECIFEALSSRNYLWNCIDLSQDEWTEWLGMLQALCRHTSHPNPVHLLRMLFPIQDDLSEPISVSHAKPMVGDLLTLHFEGRTSSKIMCHYARMMNHVVQKNGRGALIVFPLLESAVLPEKFAIHQMQTVDHTLGDLMSSYRTLLLPIRLSGDYYFLFIVQLSTGKAFVVDANIEGGTEADVKSTVDKLLNRIPGRWVVQNLTWRQTMAESCMMELVAIVASHFGIRNLDVHLELSSSGA
jgi:hypothetical protein